MSSAARLAPTKPVAPVTNDVRPFLNKFIIYLPNFPRSTVIPELLELEAILKSIHALPKTIMAIRHHFPFAAQRLERLAFKCTVVVEIFEDPLVENEKPPVYPFFHKRLFAKLDD